MPSALQFALAVLTALFGWAAAHMEWRSSPSSGAPDPHGEPSLVEKGRGLEGKTGTR